MSNESIIEVSSTINNIMVSIMTVYQRGKEHRKRLREFLIEIGLEIDELNNDVLRVIKNIHTMSKEDLQKELAK